MCLRIPLLKYIINRRNRVGSYEVNESNELYELNESNINNINNINNVNNIFYLSEERLVNLNCEIKKCIICFDRTIKTELSCGHRIMCYMCTYRWIMDNNKNTCPVCRKIINYVNIAYKLSFNV